MMQTVLQSRTSDEATAALMTLCNTGASSASEAGVLLQVAQNTPSDSIDLESHAAYSLSMMGSNRQ